MMELEGLNFYLDGVTNFTFCLIGMTINAAAIGMLCRQKTTSIFVKLMITLVTYDLVYVFLSATCFSLPRLSTTFDDKVRVHVAPYLVPVTQMALSGSVYTTVALTVERYISVVVPFFRTRHNLKSGIFIGPVALFVVIYNIPRFFESTTAVQCPHLDLHLNRSSTSPNQSWIDKAEDEYDEIWTNENCTTVVEVTDLRMNPYYISIYCNYLNLIVNIFLPLALMVGMNVCVYSTMRNRWFRNETGDLEDHQAPSSLSTQERGIETGLSASHPPPPSHRHHLFSRQGTTYSMRRVGGLNEAEFKKRDAKYTRASVVMVVAFVICNTPRCIPNIMEIIVGLEDSPTWVWVLIQINHLLGVVNSSFNFLIYWSFCGGQQFRGPGHSKGISRKTTITRLDTIRGTKSSGGDLVSPSPLSSCRIKRLPSTEETTPAAPAGSSSASKQLRTVANNGRPMTMAVTTQHIGHRTGSSSSSREEHFIETIELETYTLHEINS